ncbi:hypothetical protein EB796_007360 [Bugula neritina]|uniref:Uncharacterized protein n=1 Tax=Bugula neritina TaxID=10212 RepID=A0A7J7K909_BUGNE|nr:hypothetical protein EB796_007360 [Bugula neritina]
MSLCLIFSVMNGRKTALYLNSYRITYLLQVTTFATLMNVEHDLKNLEIELFSTIPGSKVKNIFLTDCTKEDHFRDQLINFYKGHTECSLKLLIVQCEAADQNSELLDSVRYIIHEEAAETTGPSTCTVLLLSFPRGQTLTGYQGRKWHCIHIDDPSSADLSLPSVYRCMGLSPCQMISETSESVHSPATLLCRLVYDKDSSVNILDFLIKCIPSALSLTVLGQWADRAKLLKDLLLNNPKFSKRFLDLLKILLDDQDNYLKEWVQDKAASAQSLKTTETLRYSLQSCLEKCLINSMAELINCIDKNSNMKLLKNPGSWKKSFCLQIFTNCDILRATIKHNSKQESQGNDMKTCDVENQLSEPIEGHEVNNYFEPIEAEFPFSWLIWTFIENLLDTKPSYLLPPSQPLHVTMVASDFYENRRT